MFSSFQYENINLVLGYIYHGVLLLWATWKVTILWYQQGLTESHKCCDSSRFALVWIIHT
jgi:hypothetical protein